MSFFFVRSQTQGWNRLRGGSSCTRNSAAQRTRLSERGQRFYYSATGRWLSRDALGDHASPGAQTIHGAVARRFARAAMLNLRAALDENATESERLDATLEAMHWLEGIRTLCSGDPSFSFRWRDPFTGGHLSNVPIGINGGLNESAFCANDVMDFVDPWGFDPNVGYDTPGQAGQAADMYGHPSDGEPGGLLYKKDGKYYHTPPAPKREGSGSNKAYPHDAEPFVPCGAIRIGDWHNHPKWGWPGAWQEDSQAAYNDAKCNKHYYHVVNTTARSYASGWAFTDFGDLAWFSGSVSKFPNVPPGSV